jgi:hypothetical protein
MKTLPWAMTAHPQSRPARGADRRVLQVEWTDAVSDARREDLHDRDRRDGEPDSSSHAHAEHATGQCEPHPGGKKHELERERHQNLEEWSTFTNADALWWPNRCRDHGRRAHLLGANRTIGRYARR